jgi:hypothetical protein
MSTKRRIEVFSAGCAACEETVAMVKRLACPSCDVAVLDMHDPAVATRANGYGVTRSRNRSGWPVGRVLHGNRPRRAVA